MASTRSLVRRLMATALGSALALTAAVHTPAAATGGAPVPIPPDGTAYFGVHLDWGLDSPSAYATRTGLSPAVYGEFVHFPLSSTAKSSLAGRVERIAAQGGALLLTVETGALTTVTEAAAHDLAATLATYNARGVDVLLRFAHEMNGSWYPWGQQPSAYRSAFQRVATAVRAQAPRTAMVWAPNYGGGYPFTGGTYAAKSGTTDFAELDTNRDGRLTMADDPYGPYYPGDGFVDWVGLTAYHFGHAWPWGENEVPEAGKLEQFLRGTYTGNGLYENQSAVPDFYAAYAVDRGKPMMLAETGALFNETPPASGATQQAIKTAWLDQVYSTTARTRLPQVKMVSWFEIRKYEGETRSVIDWRATFDPTVREALRGHVTTGRYVFAGTGVTQPPPGGTEPPPGGTEPPPTVEEPTTPPNAPASVRASSSSSRVQVSWQPPAGGSAVSGYQVCLGSTSCRDVGASTLSATFDGLPRRTAYTVRVVAVNAAGRSAPATANVSTK
jgi:hypothetical protein